MTADLEGVETFIAVAEAGGFRAAGARLGVTGSAVSQTIRRLEERLGVALLQRTTRSVRLTEAGKRFYAAVRPALEEIRAAAAAAGEMAAQPRGTLRILAARTAHRFLNDETLAGFLRRYPEVGLDLIVSDEPADIVAEGYDAGVRLGEVIDQDMISVPVSDPLRLIVVGSPDYLAEHTAPEHPRDLVRHITINYREGPGQRPYAWEFTGEDGRDFAVALPSRIITNETPLILRLALRGVGLALVEETLARPYLQRGELVSALEEFSTPFPGFYLYYPARSQASAALRALIDYLLEIRQRERQPAR